MLSISESVHSDTSLTSIQIHSYAPYNPSFKNSDEIRISIQNQDLLIQPSESFIYIEGTFEKSDASEATPAVPPQFINNCMAFLFDQIRYELNGVEIDKCNQVGLTSTIKGYLSFNQNESSSLMYTGWATTPNVTNDSFNFCIPLKHLLGFAEDFKKVIVNAKHELILIRSRNNVNCYKSTIEMNVNIDKLQWKMPHINVSDGEKLKILKSIQRNVPFKASYRTWELFEYPVLPTTNKHLWTVKTSSQLEKPRYVIVAFQTNRKNLKDKDMSQFDHCDVTNIKLFLNSEQYPYDNLNLNFEKDQFSLLYSMYIKFQQSFYNRTSEPMLSFSDFKKIAPLFVIDCSRQNESLKTAPVDVRLEIEFDKNIEANTSAYCLIVHDRVIEYNSFTNIVTKL